MAYGVGKFVRDARHLLGSRLINAVNDRVIGKIQGGSLHRHHHHRAHMVKGSHEARAHMAHLRSLRRRR